MIWFFIIIAVVVFYVAVVFVDVHTETMYDIKFHDGGFLNMGYTTHSNRDATPRDVRRALIWPIRGIWWFTKATIWIMADVTHGFLLIFNYCCYCCND